jgi:hypothetical protein
MTDGICGKCQQSLSLERGITRIDGGTNPGLFCTPCAGVGKGYTLADLQEMRDEIRATRARYQLGLMDRVGPDVYFAIKRDD